MSLRLKGQETRFSLTDPDGVDDPIGDVKSFEAELDIETLEEGYLGETANQYDDIYNGVSGTVELHVPTTRWFELTEKIQDRSERRAPAAGRFTAQSTFAFPSGERARITFEDIFFGPLPFRAPSRGEYVTVSLTWKCSRIRRVL